MANALANLFTDIADSIRSKTGSTEKLSPSEFASQIDSISVGGGGAEGCATVTFMNGDNVLLTRPVYIGDDCPDPVTQGRIETPTKESTVQYHYTYKGWTSVDGGTANSNVLKNITEDKVVYSAYTQSTRYYTVNFYDGNTLLKTEQIVYGGSSTYVPEARDNYMFTGWTPSPTNITGNLDCYGVWEELVVEVQEITDSWEDIVAAINNGTHRAKYKLGNYKPLDLGSEGVVNMQIVAFGADALADGSGNAKTTWVAKEVLKTYTCVEKDSLTIGTTEYLDLPSWKYDDELKEWVSLNRDKASDAKVKWTSVASEDGTFTISYCTFNYAAAYGKLTITMNGTTFFSAGSTKQEWRTKTFNLKKGDTITVEATYQMTTEGESAAYYGSIVFEGVGSKTMEAVIENAPIKVISNLQGGHVGGWEVSDLRTYCKDTVKPLIPAIVRNSIKSVAKTSLAVTANGNCVDVITTDEVWTLSAREATGTTMYEQSGPAYTALFPDFESRKRATPSGSYQTWWLRSVNIMTVRKYASIDSYGKIDDYYGLGQYERAYVCPCFCI